MEKEKDTIANNKGLFQRALRQAHLEYPPKKRYDYNPSECKHNYNFVIYCDSSWWDIARCNKCGDEIVTPCTFDDDYD